MLYAAKKYNLRGQGTEVRMLDPRVIWNLCLDDELDSNLVSYSAIPCRHNESVPARTEFIAKLVCVYEIRIEEVPWWEKGRVEVGIEVEGEVGDWEPWSWGTRMDGRDGSARRR